MPISDAAAVAKALKGFVANVKVHSGFGCFSRYEIILE